MAEEHTIQNHLLLGQRVRSRGEVHQGQVIARTPDGLVVVAWDDGYVDEIEPGNVYDYSEVVGIE